MYLPGHFEIRDEAKLDRFIAANSFATLVSLVGGSLFASHIPMLLDRDGAGKATLLGHVAIGNKHQRAFDGEHEALAIFHGPHSYVSPAWYAEAPAVPTWNYAVVHVHGYPRAVEDETWLSDFVDRLTRIFDPEYAARTELPAEFKSRMLKGIVGFRMPVDRIEGKYKLSQNRSQADQRGVIDALGEHDLASMMREIKQ
jgi:transcriptional regulator